jgi:pantoate kinase
MNNAGTDIHLTTNVLQMLTSQNGPVPSRFFIPLGRGFEISIGVRTFVFILVVATV